MNEAAAAKIDLNDGHDGEVTGRFGRRISNEGGDDGNALGVNWDGENAGDGESKEGGHDKKVGAAILGSFNREGRERGWEGDHAEWNNANIAANAGSGSGPGSSTHTGQANDDSIAPAVSNSDGIHLNSDDAGGSGDSGNTNEGGNDVGGGDLWGEGYGGGDGGEGEDLWGLEGDNGVYGDAGTGDAGEGDVPA